MTAAGRAARAPKSARRLVSAVLPVFNEQDNIAELQRRLTDLARERADLDWEFIYVNDGSRDGSLERLVALAAADPRVVVIDLSRNFGHQVAVTAGLDHARGNAVVIMDTDLQDPPEVVLELLKKWEEGYDVAYAQRRTRRDSWFKRVTAAAYYRLLRRLSDTDIPLNTGDFRLIDRKVLDVVVTMREHHRFLRGMISYVGFKQVAVPFDRDERHAGETAYPLRTMIRFAVDGILGFSTTPLRLISRTGYAFSVLSIIGIIYAIVMKFARPDITVPGWTLTIIAILLIGGLQFVFLGVLGSYVARIYSEAKGRPLYAVRETWGRDGDG